MTKVWYLINRLQIKTNIKSILFLLILTGFYGAIGGLCWFLITHISLSETTWFICFISYPAVIFGLFRGVLFLFNHEYK